MGWHLDMIDMCIERRPMTMENMSITDLFGLDYEETRVLLSIQRMIAEYDCEMAPNSKDYITKKKWIYEWEKSVLEYLDEFNGDAKASLIYNKQELNTTLINMLSKSSNVAWYKLIILECLCFVPYTALGSDYDKKYSKCKFHEKKCADYLKQFFLNQGKIKQEELDRLMKTYDKSLKKISNPVAKTALKIVTPIAVAGIAAVAATLAAPALAVALVGEGFAGLHGIALTNACLALLGGGAVAIGGYGIVGGTAVIAGGGALLGLIGGSAMVGTASVLLSSPELTLSQAAKLETVLKEIILNSEKDVLMAQAVITRLEEVIVSLNSKLTKQELELDKQKEDIKNLKKCIEYLTRTHKDMKVFASAFATGLEAEEE